MPLLTRLDEIVEVPDRLPVLALRDLVFFPYVVLPLLVGRPRSVAALEAAGGPGGLVLLVAQRNATVEDPTAGDLHRVGTIARIVESQPAGEGTVRVVLEGLGRGRIQEWSPEPEGSGPFIAALTTGEILERSPDPLPPSWAGIQQRLQELYVEYAQLHEQIPPGTAPALTAPGDPVRQTHLLGGHLLVPATDRQTLLEEDDACRRMELLRSLLEREVELLRVEARIDEAVRRQREADRELPGVGEALPTRGWMGGGGTGGGGRDADPEWADVERAVAGARLPPHALERAERELGRLRKLNPVAPEAVVISGAVRP